jgi:hypothetical protein
VAIPSDAQEEIQEEKDRLAARIKELGGRVLHRNSTVEKFRDSVAALEARSKV